MYIRVYVFVDDKLVIMNRRQPPRDRAAEFGALGFLNVSSGPCDMMLGAPLSIAVRPPYPPLSLIDWRNVLTGGINGSREDGGVSKR